MATTTINTDITITVIRQSVNGAWLITDGVKQAWARPASRRTDGTWTPSAYKALQLSDKQNLMKRENKLTSKNAKKNMNVNNNLYISSSILIVLLKIWINPIR